MKTILVIDDNTDIRENIAELLELEQYEVHTAPDGETGVILAREKLPDLVLCDIMMPGLDGPGVFMELNQSIETAGIPFIFLTAKNEISTKRNAENLAGDEYIIKPFDPEHLLEALRVKLDEHERTRVEILDYLKKNAVLYKTGSIGGDAHTEMPLCACLGLLHLLKKPHLENESLEHKIKEHVPHINAPHLFSGKLRQALEDVKQKKIDALSIEGF